MRSQPLPPAGWYPDPAGSDDLRYWSGSQWTTELKPVAVKAQPPSPQWMIATSGVRAVALIIDILIVTFVQLVITLLIVGPSALWADMMTRQVDGPSGFWMSGSVTAVLWLIYKATTTRFFGASLGQLLFRLRVTRDGDLTNSPLPTMQAVLRAAVGGLTMVFPLLILVDAIPMMNSRENKTLHDLAVNSVVVTKI